MCCERKIKPPLRENFADLNDWQEAVVRYNHYKEIEFIKMIEEIEEKAKRYDEALEKARQLCAYPTTKPFISDLQDLFPELAESEDEKIRKAIHIYLDWLDGKKDCAPRGEYSIRDMIAWLEKQKPAATPIEGEFPYTEPSSTLDGEIKNIWNKLSFHGEFTVAESGFSEVIHHFANWLEKQGKNKGNNKLIWKHWSTGIAGNGDGEPIYLIKTGNTYSLSSCLGFECDYIELSELDNLMLEKQGEQKLSDKIESKFKVGDLIRLKDGDGLEWTIKEMHHDGYYTVVCEDREDFIYLDDRWELVGKLVDKIEAKFHEGEWITIKE